MFVGAKNQQDHSKVIDIFNASRSKNLKKGQHIKSAVIAQTALLLR